MDNLPSIIDFIDSRIKMAEWKETFALLPCKTISGRRVWLKKVYYRRLTFTPGGFHAAPTIEYGDVFDILTGN